MVIESVLMLVIVIEKLVNVNVLQALKEYLVKGRYVLELYLVLVMVFVQLQKLLLFKIIKIYIIFGIKIYQQLVYVIKDMKVMIVH